MVSRVEICTHRGNRDFRCRLHSFRWHPCCWLTNYPGTVIIGSVFATFAPEKVICHPQVTAVCIGKGERTLARLCHVMQKDEPLTGIEGLWVKHAAGAADARIQAPNGQGRVNRSRYIGPRGACGGLTGA